jgi:hypothetical protein
LANAIPAKHDPNNMSARASALDPSSHTRRRLALNKRNASCARTSDTGFFFNAEVRASMACTMASMPVAAVTRGGTDRVKLPSSTAASGNRWGLTMPIFELVPVVTMEIGVTSLPVPAVVGTWTNGNRVPTHWSTPYKSGNVWVVVPCRKATTFATSMDDPPPNPRTPSTPAAASVAW